MMEGLLLMARTVSQPRVPHGVLAKMVEQELMNKDDNSLARCFASPSLEPDAGKLADLQQWNP